MHQQLDEFLESILASSTTDGLRETLESQRLASPNDLADALKAKADHYLRSDKDMSIRACDVLQRYSQWMHNPRYEALSSLALANVRSIGEGNYESALELYEKAAAIYREVEDTVFEARAQIGKVGALANLGRHDEADRAGEWAAPVLEQHKEWRPLADLIMNLAIMHARKGDDSKSLELFNEAGDAFKKLGEDGIIGFHWVQLNRAHALKNLGRFDEAIQECLEAKDGLRRLGQTVAAARADQMRALTYYLVGSYNDALDLLLNVRDVYLDDGRYRDAILVDLFISDTYLQLGRFEDVLEKCREVRSTFAELGVQKVVAQAILNEAVAYAHLGSFEKASQSIHEARDHFALEGNHALVSICDLEIAGLELESGNGEASFERAIACAHQFEQLGLRVEQTRALLQAARAALTGGKPASAGDHLNQATQIADQLSIPMLKFEGARLAGDIAREKGDLAGAVDAYENAIDEIERLRGRIMIEFRVGFLFDKSSVYEDAVLACVEIGDTERALSFVERGKSRALLDMAEYGLNAGITARSPEDQQMLDELMLLRAERDRVYRRWLSDGEIRERGFREVLDQQAKSQQDVQQIEKQITALWHRLLIQDPEYARDAMHWTVHSRNVQHLLTPGTAIVEFYIARNQLLVFAIAEDSLQLDIVEFDRDKLARLLDLLSLNISTAPLTDPNQLGQLAGNANALLNQLWMMLLSKSDSRLAGISELVIVPHGILHYVPFHALHDGERYLIERFDICYLPASSLLPLCLDGGLNPKSLMAVGYSNEGQLPFSVLEANKVADAMSGDVVLEGRAKRSQIINAMPQYDLIHFATHAEFRADNPLFSGLVLADGWLTSMDIFSSPLGASHVTLSACNTGRSVVAPGDELIGLMRAFLAAGASSLLLSHWPVEDRSTADFMEDFYLKHLEGKRKATALSEIQRSRIALEASDTPSRRALAHPYFWSSFFLVGGVKSFDSHGMVSSEHVRGRQKDE